MGRIRKLEPNALSRLAADLRERTGLSLVKLSEQTGRSRWALRDYEQGAYQTPVGYIALLAQVLAEQEAASGHIAADQTTLLAEVNAAITACHGRRRTFADWKQLVAAAENWRATRQTLEEAVNGHEVAFDPTSLSIDLALPAQPSPALPPPRSQLRAATPDFVGRAAEIARLTQALAASAERGGVVSICGIRGMGGMGKTELAYRVAQAVAPAFPDAQLVLELRGTAPDPLSPEEALQTILRSFAPHAAPLQRLAELRAHYRTLLRDKRVLIVADDARDAKVLRELAPPPGSALIVTSRWRFSLEGMIDEHVVELGGLGEEEAVALLRTLCPRIGAFAPRLAALCAFLPLALRIAAGRLASDATLSIERYFRQLEDERTRLAALSDADDAKRSVAAVIGLSYAALDPVAQSVLAQLSVFPASFAREAVPAVVEVACEPQQGRVAVLDAALSRLHRASMLEYYADRERFALHDLVRCFAAERLVDVATKRLHHAAAYAFFARQIGPLVRDGAAGLQAALAHADAELANLDAGIAWVLAQPPADHIDALLLDYLLGLSHIGPLRIPPARWLPFCEAALEAARRHERPDMEALALNALGSALGAVGDHRRAYERYSEALAAARSLDDAAGVTAIETTLLHNIAQSLLRLGDVRAAIAHAEELRDRCYAAKDLGGGLHALLLLGWAQRLLGAPQVAIPHYEPALQLARALGDERSQIRILNNLANAIAALQDPSDKPGAYARACNYAHEASMIAERLGDEEGRVHAVIVLGNAATLLGAPRDALPLYHEALALARRRSNRFDEAVVLGNIGDAHRQEGDHAEAANWYAQALAISDELGDALGGAKARWYLGVALLHQGEMRRAVPLLRAAVAFEQQVGHVDAASHAEQFARVEAWLAQHGA